MAFRYLNKFFMAKGGPREGSNSAHAVIEQLSPEQRVVIQKLLKSRIGVRLGPDGGDWLLEGVKVSLTDHGVKIEGLNCEQSGQPRGGRGQSLMELIVGEGLSPTASMAGSTYRLNVEFGFDSLGSMNEADFAVLFGEELARTLTIAAVAEGEFKKGAVSDVAFGPDPVIPGAVREGDALSAALKDVGDGSLVTGAVRRALGGEEIEE